jgi:hypothetical protein
VNGASINPIIFSINIVALHLYSSKKGISCVGEAIICDNNKQL